MPRLHGITEQDKNLKNLEACIDDVPNDNSIADMLFNTFY